MASSTSATDEKLAVPSDAERASTSAFDADSDAPRTKDAMTSDELALAGDGGAAEPATATAAEPDAKTAAPPAPGPTRSKLEITLIMVALCSGVFLAALDVSIVSTTIPTIVEEFNDAAGYTWIGGAYVLAYAAAAPMWGKISDIWGRKPVLLVAIAIFWIGSLVSALARNTGMLIVARAIQGIGGGGTIVLVNIVLSDLFSPRERGMYLGLTSMMWAFAGGVGPVVGGAFTTKVTWRWAFYLNLPVAGVGFFLTLFALKLHNPKTPIRQGLAAIDWLGALTVVGGTLMILLGLEFGGVIYPWDSATVICLIVFGVFTLGIFGVVEWKLAKYPVIPLHLFKSRSNVAALGVCFCHGLTFIAGTYYLPLYFQAVLGASALLSGVYVLAFTLAFSTTSAFTGFLMRKTGKYVPIIISGMVIMTLGFGLFIDLEPRANWAKIIVFQIIAGLGVGCNFQPPLMALQSRVQPRDIASATATFQFMRQLATSISIVIGGVIFQNSMQKQYSTLVAEIGSDYANLLTGSSAGGNVAVVAAIPGEAGEIARAAYWDALRSMYVMYVCFGALGSVVSLFVSPKKLSTDHVEHKTGLQGLMHVMSRGHKRDEEKAAGPPAEDKEESA